MRYFLFIALLTLCSCKCEITVDTQDFFYSPPKPVAAEPGPKPTYEERDCNLSSYGLGKVRQHGWKVLSQIAGEDGVCRVIMRRPLTAEAPTPTDPVILKLK